MDSTVRSCKASPRAQVSADDPHGAIQKQQGDDLFILGGFKRGKLQVVIRNHIRTGWRRFEPQIVQWCVIVHNSAAQFVTGIGIAHTRRLRVGCLI